MASTKRATEKTVEPDQAELAAKAGEQANAIESVDGTLLSQVAQPEPEREPEPLDAPEISVGEERALTLKDAAPWERPDCLPRESGVRWIEEARAAILPEIAKLADAANAVALVEREKREAIAEHDAERRAATLSGGELPRPVPIEIFDARKSLAEDELLAVRRDAASLGIEVLHLARAKRADLERLPLSAGLIHALREGPWGLVRRTDDGRVVHRAWAARLLKDDQGGIDEIHDSTPISDEGQVIQVV